jgi:DNA-binding MarR family transcriptional regulator
MLITREIHRLLRALQIKNRRVRKGSALPVSIAEAHVLLELSAGGELSVNELVQDLFISQTQMSRILQRLRARRFIQQRNVQTDGRKVVSSLTRSGLTVIERIDEVMGDIYQECAKRLRKEEAIELSITLESIAHGFGCKHIRRRKDESKLRAAHRQMARVFGVLSNSVYGSDLSRSQWSILESIVRAPEPINATVLEKYLGIKPTVISEILNRFELQGYIERKRSRENHRVNHLHPTNAGRRYFGRLETQAVIRLHKALRGTSLPSHKRGLELLKRFAGEWGAHSIYLGTSLVTEVISEPPLIKCARAFVLREIVRLGWEEYAPDPIVSSEQHVWGLRDVSIDGHPLRAVCVVSEKRTAWVVTLAVWSSVIDQRQARAFIQHAHYLSQRRGAGVPLVVQFAPVVELCMNISSDKTP